MLVKKLKILKKNIFFYVSNNFKLKRILKLFKLKYFFIINKYEKMNKYLI